MDYSVLLKELESLAQQLGIKIRYEKGNFDGGYCILKDQKILVINKKLFDSRKSSILARGIAEIGIDNLYIKPAIRQYIEDEVAKFSKGAGK
ncbi:MAG: hypothetical protein IGBAC_1232 [Ignavibacteriae bacterium]|nr:MAG: hypothetical protein IGBAC_1232 [Ignavibacteriota bacterium]